MPEFRVPNEAIPAFRTLLGLNAADFSRFLAVTIEGPRASSLEEIAERIVELDIAGLTLAHTQPVLKLLASLRLVIENTGKPTAFIVKQLAYALKSHSGLPTKLTETELKNLSDRLESLLISAGTLTMLTRARNLATDNARSFHGARVITDIRPVFDSSTINEPLAFTTVHSLKIIFREDRHLKEFFVVLSADDLSVLKDVISRAEDKEQSISIAIGAAGLNMLKLAGDAE